MGDLLDDVSGWGCVILVVLVVVVAFLGAWVMTIAWNWLMPELFGLPEITFWQMVVLSFITNGLTGGSSLANRGSSN